MTLPSSSLERRASARRRACLGGSIRVTAFLPEMECRLRDLSLDGCRIVVAEDATLAQVFELTLACRAETRRVTVMWRSGDQAGLRFVTQAEIDAAAHRHLSGQEPRTAMREPTAQEPAGRLH